MSIRDMALDDVDDVVRVHMQSFPGFFLTFLGTRFLRLLYRGILIDAGGVALVAVENAKVVGFVAGTRDQSGFYRRLLRTSLLSFVLASAWAALRRPLIAPRLFRALRRSSESSAAAAQACLMSVAVVPGIEGRGVGRHLVNQFCEILRQGGVPAVSLTTDRYNNDRVNRFYHDLGFTIARHFATPEGRHMTEYVMDLAEAPTNATSR